MKAIPPAAFCLSKSSLKRTILPATLSWPRAFSSSKLLTTTTSVVMPSADLDLGQIARGKFDLDVVGHYARPDVFRLVVDGTSREPVSWGPTDGQPPRREALTGSP